MHRRVLIALAFALLMLVAVQSASAQTVVYRQKLGAFPEASEYISTGPFAGNIAILDGNDVYFLPRNAKSSKEIHRQFSLYEIPFYYHPNGFAYIPQERRFVYTEGNTPLTLKFSDLAGHPTGEVPIQYIDSFFPNYSLEEITYVPPDAPIYPDHFIMAAGEQLDDGTIVPTLQVIRRDGQVIKMIKPPLVGDIVGGVTYNPPGEVIFSWGDRVFRYDLFTDTLMQTGPPLGWFEGITMMPDGALLGVGIDLGTYGYLNNGLDMIPETYSSYNFGLNLRSVGGLAWDSDSNRFLVYTTYEVGTQITHPQVISFTPQLTGLRTFAEFSGNRAITYMPDEHVLAALFTVARPPNPTNSQIRLYKEGLGLTETLTIPNSGGGLFAYIEQEKQFIVRGALGPTGTTTATLLVVARDGSLVKTIDVSHFNTAFYTVAYIPDDETGGRLLLSTNPHLFIITDMDGNELTRFSHREHMEIMRPTRIAPITSGPYKGGFAVTDNGGELKVFKLTGQLR